MKPKKSYYQNNARILNNKISGKSLTYLKINFFAERKKKSKMLSSLFCYLRKELGTKVSYQSF